MHKGCTLEMVSRGVGWGIGAQSGNKAGSLHGLSYSWLPHHAYLKQWAAVRIQWGSRMLPPQTCCLLYWMLTCHGQESTEASTPPTTRGVFRLFPHSGFSGGKRKEGESGFWEGLPPERPLEQGPQEWYRKDGRTHPHQLWIIRGKTASMTARASLRLPSSLPLGI